MAVFSIPVVSSGVSAEEPSAGGAASPRTHEVRVPRDRLIFEPALLKIRPGDTVQWINGSDKVHVFASIPGSGTNDKEIFSPMMKPGETWSHTFEKAGDYPYFCFIHSQMMGAIVVEETPSPEEKAP
ncbi:MAG: plastocyanin [Nitrospirae bacterium]|nr:plastocyanin [Nitrospirota bacterium]